MRLRYETEGLACGHTDAKFPPQVAAFGFHLQSEALGDLYWPYKAAVKCICFCFPISTAFRLIYKTHFR